MTRVQDDHLAVLVGGTQVWPAQGWHDRFGLSLDATDTGFGHSAGQVATVRAPARLLTAELVAAASRLLERLDDEEALSLRGVAREAGIAPQSVYLHFDDRKALLDAVFEARFADLLAELEAAAEPETEPRARLRALCHAYCRYGLAHPGHYRVPFRTPGRLAWEPHELKGMPTLRLLADAVEACRPGEDPFPVTVCLWASLHGLVTLRQDRSGFPWPALDDLLETVVAAYCAGGYQTGRK
ncbi:WHG domain-containing protein [Amycolatopsis cynarae]|uniref:WHG domain-containing protein n=1 Tax=Amycolatopsis cynarae TaxID=2995223 RepID=A0ABY7BAM9_9PSEU|nr:WHG domain-containing protein [Amycolatopsis sp. HUAS 11-8]WAL68733.1 WHG domain-containing protein [Amycolatopsis sp. HUAS 11-8]